MVRGIQVEAFDHVARPIIAVGNEFPDGHVIAPHRHRRSQLLYGACGAMMVTTEQGAWVVPPQRGVWIPGGVTHHLRMLGRVGTRSLYLEPEAASGMPARCQVVEVSPFMRNLLLEAVNLPAEYDTDSRAGALMSLILHELPRLPVLPLSLRFPTHPKLAQQCKAFLWHPTPHQTIDDWSAALSMSRRAFTRLFRQETGISFVAWRQQACLITALPRLAAGEPVTSVAVSLGYDNPAAFTTMFKRVLGAPPSQYLRQDVEAAPGAMTSANSAGTISRS